MACRQLPWQLLWQLGLFLGIPITQLLRTRSKGWVGMWDGYQMSHPALHCSELEQLLAALLVFCRFQICDVFAGAAVDGLCSPQHSTTQFNQLIKCNVWQCTAQLLQSTFSRHYSFVLTSWTRSSWVIWFAINEYCCLSKPLFHWIHSQPVLRYLCWKWKWKVKSGSRSKTGIFPGLFVLSTNVWTGGYLVFKSF